MISVSRNFENSLEEMKEAVKKVAEEKKYEVHDIDDARITRAFNPDTEEYEDELRLTLEKEEGMVLLKPTTYKPVKLDPILTIDCKVKFRGLAEEFLDAVAEKLK